MYQRVAYISPFTNKLHMVESFIGQTVGIQVTLKLEPNEYEAIVPLDFLYGEKDLTDCEELWELFKEYEEAHVVKEIT